MKNVAATKGQRVSLADFLVESVVRLELGVSGWGTLAAANFCGCLLLTKRVIGPAAYAVEIPSLKNTNIAQSRKGEIEDSSHLPKPAQGRDALRHEVMRF
jgi:hypothetical protein